MKIAIYITMIFLLSCSSAYFDNSTVKYVFGICAGLAIAEISKEANRYADHQI